MLILQQKTVGKKDWLKVILLHDIYKIDNR